MNATLKQLIDEVANFIHSQQGLMKRLCVSMQGTYKHPQIETETEQFAVAVMAVYNISSCDEKRILKDNITAIAQICAFIEQCKLGKMPCFPHIETPSQGLGLLTLWSQVKAQYHVTSQQPNKPH